MLFIKALQKMLKLDLILQIMNQIDRYQKEKIKTIGLMEDELDGKNMIKSVAVRGKASSYLINGDSEDKKAKGVMKRKLEFKNYKNTLKITELKNKINHLEKNKIRIVSLKKIIKNSK